MEQKGKQEKESSWDVAKAAEQRRDGDVEGRRVRTREGR